MREKICEMCETRPANCGLIDIVNQETVFLCYHCSEKLTDIHERLWGHVVKCKDCKYWNKHHLVDVYVCSIHNKEGQYPYLLFEMDADDFCSRGELK